MGRSIPPLQQLPHGLIENRIAPQRQHITHGKHITHDNQHINKQHEHQPIGEAMTNHHAEDGDKKSILDARIERAYANEYDAAFAAATIKNYASARDDLGRPPSTAEALHKDHGRPRHSQADRPLCPKTRQRFVRSYRRLPSPYAYGARHETQARMGTRRAS